MAASVGVIITLSRIIGLKVIELLFAKEIINLTLPFLPLVLESTLVGFFNEGLQLI